MRHDSPMEHALAIVYRSGDGTFEALRYELILHRQSRGYNRKMKTGSMHVTPNSVDKAGITKDYKEAMREYILNGFEAGATSVTISVVEANELGAIDSIVISDNGSGIAYDDLESTFGAFLDSRKQATYTSGGKGKGRLSFVAFAGRAEWHTTYLQDGKPFGKEATPGLSLPYPRYILSAPTKSSPRSFATI
jgi:signal transduction histidine kinase